MTAEYDYTRIPDLPASVFIAPLKRPAHVGEDWLEPAQRDYSSDDDAIWNELFERQMELLPGRACEAFLLGLAEARPQPRRRARFRRLSARSSAALTGWSVVPVPMLIPDHVFFWHLANRRFPGGQLHPHPRAVRLHPGARRLPRRVRPRAAADRPGVRRLHAGIRPGRAGRRCATTASRRSARSTGTRSSSA